MSEIDRRTYTESLLDEISRDVYYRSLEKIQEMLHAETFNSDKMMALAQAADAAACMIDSDDGDDEEDDD